MKKLAFSILFLFISHFAFAGIDFIDVDDFKTWEDILQLAKKEKRNLIVHVFSVPCNDCKALKKTTFKDKELAALVNTNYLALKVYELSEVGKGLRSLYSLQSEASILVLNTNELLFYKHDGFIDATTLKKELNEASAKIAQYPSWQKGAAEGNLETLDWISLLLIDAQNKIVSPANPIISDVSFLLDSSDFDKAIVQEFVSTLALSIDNPIFQTLKKHPHWILESEDFKWSDYFQAVYDFNIKLAISEADSIFLEDVIYQLQQLPQASAIPNMALKSRQLYLAELEKWNAYDTITKEYLAPFPADSANLYQEEAIFLMENYKKNKPSSIALEYLRLGLRQKETFELYYTLALYLFAKEELQYAYKAGYRAWEISESNNDTAMARRLFELIDSYYY